MAEQNQENKNRQQDDKLDAAGRSLSEALRTSFIILKIIMIVLVIIFLASGFRTVGSDEQALVLRFGRIRGVGEKRLLGPGLHWVFPYPIDEIIKIPVAKKVNLPINSFWYFQTKSELLPQSPKSRIHIKEILDPVTDGYCITRSAEQGPDIAGSAGSDYNIVHCRWQLTYKIDDPERFFRNVYVEAIKPGAIYFDVITESVKPLLQDLIEDAVVTAMVNYTVDEAIYSEDRIPRHIKKLLQDKLDRIESGIAVISIQLTDVIWPRQVNEAFLASIKASQESQKAISEAKGYAENTLNEAGGPIAEKLLTTLNDNSITEKEKELLWAQVAGQAAQKIAQAQAYRTKVVETAKANADYLQKILPEYRRYPELVLQEIYQDTVVSVLENADEKMIVQPTEGAKGTEIWIRVPRDPTIKSKSKEEKEQ
jgi:regulator of protease activity HflC (stomatin/prohibitin superfamily)